MTYDLYNKDTILVTGVSGGGVGSTDWVQYVADNTKKAKVMGMSDSGIFLIDYYDPITKTKPNVIATRNVWKMVGQMDDEYIPRPIRECIKDLGDLPSCTDLTVLAPYIQVPMFFIQSTYDEYVLKYVLGMECVTN